MSTGRDIDDRLAAFVVFLVITGLALLVAAHYYQLRSTEFPDVTETTEIKIP